MRKAVVFGVLMLGACQLAPGSDQNKVKVAQERVANELRDPSSAQFRNVRHKDGWVCGEVNGSNGYGAQAGFQRFVVGPDSVTLEEITKDDATARQHFEVLWIGCD